MNAPDVVGVQPSVDVSKTAPNSSIRRLGIALFVLLFVEGALGMASAGSSLSGPSALLISHVVLGLGIVALALRALHAAVRFPRQAARRATGLTTVAIVATALTGSISLVAGFHQAGVVDRGLALVALAGSFLMILWGSVRVLGEIDSSNEVEVHHPPRTWRPLRQIDRLRSASSSTRLGRPAAAAISIGWGVALGAMFGGVLPYLLGDWHLHRPLSDWIVAQVVGGVLVAVGLVAISASFAEFVKANGTPVPVASPPRLVVYGPYRYVRNPIYVGFLAVLVGETLIVGSIGLLEYTAVALGVGVGAVHFYEEPTILRQFGADYRRYRQAVPAWIPRLHPWAPDPSSRSHRAPDTHGPPVP